MKLLQNEEKLLSSNADKIILTNQRIMMKDQVWGKSYKISIFLEDISSIEIRYKNNIIFLIIGIIFIIIGFLIGLDTRIGGLIIGGIFIALWLFNRKHLITICSKGGNSLNFIIQNMSDVKVENFVTDVQEAKLKRINSLFKI